MSDQGLSESISVCHVSVLCCSSMTNCVVLCVALPTLDISEGGLNKVFEIYKRLLPTLGGNYLTDSGQLNHPLLEALLKEMGALELDVLQERAEVCTTPDSTITLGQTTAPDVTLFVTQPC